MSGAVDNGLILRTAKKTHRCNGDGSSAHRHHADCTELIRPGEQYIECMWSAHAYGSGTRVSLPCARAFYDSSTPPSLDGGGK